MNIVVNGQPMEVATSISVAQLLGQLALNGLRVAVERNATIVPRSRHDDTLLTEGDHLEIVKAVGGG